MSEQDMYDELIKILKKEKLSKEALVKLKVKLCKKYKITKIPTNIQILLKTSSKDINKINLVAKPIRTISGVAVVAIMSKPHNCPHGTCTYCPGGPKSPFGDVPQAYTGREPATMRAIRNNYDPYLQVMNRLEHYIVLGQNPEKVELILMGGTFPSLDLSYQTDFIKYLFKAMNDFSKLFYNKKGNIDTKKFKKFFELPGDVADPDRAKKIYAKLAKLKTKTTLEKEQNKNQDAKIKCVGLTIETRADYALEKHCNEMLRQGCTRIEMGIQSVYDKALKATNRGHDVAKNIESMKIMKDFGFKINTHYMLGLPKTSVKEDLAGLKELFSNPAYKPDMLKIYPCMVMEGTALFKQYQNKQFKPMTTKVAAEIIAEAKKFIPKYVRIMRVQRDIPTYMTEAGVDRTNLRQYVEKITTEKGIVCKCIRCREVGRAKKVGKHGINVMQYISSDGNEFFIAAEDKYKNLFGFCRLRFPSQSLRKEITHNSALIRELHVYGEATGIGKKGKIQHKGIGKQLLKTAEQIAETYYKTKIVIISGIGVRNYYKKLGYKLEGPYMTKEL